jgi:hypothetical protein
VCDKGFAGLSENRLLRSDRNASNLLRAYRKAPQLLFLSSKSFHVQLP